MIRRVTLAFAAVAGVAVMLALPAGASHAWGPYHWARSANPFTLKVVDSMTSDWDPYLAEAATDWSVSNVLNLAIETGSTSSKDRRRCAAVSGKIRSCNSTYGNNGWLGQAQIWASGSHITQATAKNNDTYFNTATYNTPAWKLLVTCQEIAHDFGLAHQDETFDNANLGTCMDYTSDPDGPPSNEHPNQHDYDQLETIYTHLDSFATPKAAAGPPGEPGPMKRVGDSDSLWVQDLGNGHRLFTFVIWVDPAKRHGPPDTG